VPAGVAVIIDQMMAKTPDERYDSAQHVIEALQPWVNPQPAVDATPAAPLLPSPLSHFAPTTPTPSTIRSNRLGWSAYAVAIMLAVGLGALAGLWFQSSTAIERVTGGR
jgi:hypothetical protein